MYGFDFVKASSIFQLTGVLIAIAFLLMLLVFKKQSNK